jgi:hypothetical protein
MYLDLVVDNAAYHHKRKIGALSSLTKAKMVGLLIEHDVEHLGLPWTEDRYQYIDKHDPNFVTDAGPSYRVHLQSDPGFTVDDVKKTASKSRPFVPNTDDLKVAFATYLKEHKPDVLSCHVK